MDPELQEHVKDIVVAAMNEYLQQEIDLPFRLLTGGDDEKGKEYINSRLKQEKDGENPRKIRVGK